MRELRPHEAILHAAVRKAVTDGQLNIPMARAAATKLRAQIYALGKSLRSALEQPGNAALGAIVDDFDNVTLSIIEQGANAGLQITSKASTPELQALAAAIGELPADPIDESLNQAAQDLMKKLLPKDESGGSADVIPLASPNTYYTREK